MILYQHLFIPIDKTNIHEPISLANVIIITESIV